MMINLVVAMDSVERITVSRSQRPEIQEAVRRLSLIGSGDQRNCSFSVCAQIYLAFIYKFQGDDFAAIRMLLQAFSNAPGLTRRNLMPDLWEILFLPHFLHLRDWYEKETEATVEEERIKEVERVYEDQIDVCTAQFAAYYKDLVKSGFSSRVLPSIEVPPTVTVTRSPEKCSPNASLSSSGEREAEIEDGVVSRGISVHVSTALFIILPFSLSTPRDLRNARSPLIKKYDPSSQKF